MGVTSSVIGIISIVLLFILDAKISLLEFFFYLLNITPAMAIPAILGVILGVTGIIIKKSAKERCIFDIVGTILCAVIIGILFFMKFNNLSTL